MTRTGPLADRLKVALALNHGRPAGPVAGRVAIAGANRQWIMPPDSATGSLATAKPCVIDAAVRVNAANVSELSELDHERLQQLVGEAFHASVLGDGEAFLLAFDETAQYDSPNFRWFQARFSRFVYIDRVVVHEASRGRGYGRRLYRDLMEAAQAAGHSLVACEINVEPPNPASDALHHSWGFQEVGRARLGPGKSVRYMTRSVGE